MKKCSKCGEEKPATEEYFHKDKRLKYGLHTICKQCRNQDEKCRRNQLKIKNINISSIYTVYAHINKINNKIYIGQTKKKTNYRWSYGEGYNHNSIFYNDIQKYGWNNFEHEVVASGLTKEEAENFEKLLIKKLDTTNFDNGYNVQTGGGKGFTIGYDVTFSSSKKVICDNIIFNSIKDCAEYYGIKGYNMRNWLSGKSEMPQKFIDINLKYYIELY